MNEPTVAPRGDRIAKLLARAGVASRREIERMIAEGRVALDGTVLDTPATILQTLRGVTVDGKPVAPPDAARLFLYHKPAGLLVTERDPAGRSTIYDRLPHDLPRTMPVGRLDLATEGLLLLTTDGGLKRQLELPATGVERTYRARAYGDVTQAMLEDLMDGIEIDGIRYGPIDANLERRTGANTWIELTLTEGKNREVRRVLEHLGLQVGRLIRTRYGPFILADLPPGEVGEVKQHELVAFTKTLGGTRRAKGADLQTLVTVEPRAKPPIVAPPAPAPRAAPPVRAASPPAAAARTTKAAGWGSRTRPSRPAAPDARSARPPFRLADAGDRPSRDDVRSRPAQRVHSDRTGPRPPRGTDTPPQPSGGRSNRHAQARFVPDPDRGAMRNVRSGDPRGSDRPAKQAASPRAGSAPPGRAARTASDPRTDRAVRGSDAPRTTTPRTAGPGKGPAGGRGRPPRPSDGAPRKGPPRGPKGGR